MVNFTGLTTLNNISDILISHNGSSLNSSAFLLNAQSVLRRPDFYVCDPLYGHGLSSSDAIKAIRALPRGSTPIAFQARQPQAPWHIPYLQEYNDVMVTIEIAGPVNPVSVSLVPDVLNEMAFYVVNHCLISEGTGGFVTVGFSRLTDYINDISSNLRPPYPDSALFSTVGVMRKSNRLEQPGNHDPEVAENLYLSAEKAYEECKPRRPFGECAILQARSAMYGFASIFMQRGGTRTWWEAGKRLLETQKTPASS